MITMYKITVVLLLVFHIGRFSVMVEAADKSIISEKILSQLKNAVDFETFQGLLKNIDLKSIFENPAVKAGFKQSNIDVSMLADVKMEDMLKVFDLKKVYEDVKKADPLTVDVLLGSLYKNVNTMALISNVDWAKLFQNSVSRGGIQLPGMSAMISLECTMDLVKVFSPLLNANFTDPTTIWKLVGSPAVKMLDAMAKIPSGILGGNMRWFGAYDECQTVKDQAKFCKVGAKVLGQHAEYGTCMPKKCSNVDVLMLHVLLAKTLLPASIPPEIFSFKSWALCDTEVEYSSGFIVTVVVSAIIMLLLLLGTFVDVVVGGGDDVTTNTKESNHIPLTIHNKHIVENGHAEKAVSNNNPENNYGALKNEEASPAASSNANIQKPSTPIVLRLLTSFSLTRNIKAVLATDVPRGAIECINGIRAISMFWVILGHVYVFAALMPNDNIATMIPDIIQRYTSQAIVNAFVSVDSFFLLSGLLVAYLTLKRMDKTNGKINIVMYYVHRFIRLTPPYMFVILLWTNIFPYTIRGPNAEGDRLAGDGGMCSKYWWTNLLYISNFYPTKMSEECLGWSWYLSNDMQFYIIAPGILYLMFILERKFKETSFRHVGPFLVVLTGCLISIMIRMILIGVNDYPALIASSMINPKTAARQDALYIKPYTRISPYLVGIFLGYMLSRKLNFVSEKGMGVKFLGWLIAVLLGYAAVYGPYASAYKMPTDGFNKTENVLFGGFSSFVWAIAVSWVIYACHYGFGGWVNSFLSWRIWTPLSRLTFGAYLFHPIVIFFFIKSHEKPYHFQDTILPFDIISITAMSYGCAFILAVGLEYPVLNLEKLAFKQ